MGRQPRAVFIPDFPVEVMQWRSFDWLILSVSSSFKALPSAFLQASRLGKDGEAYLVLAVTQIQLPLLEHLVVYF